MFVAADAECGDVRHRQALVPCLLKSIPIPIEHRAHSDSGSPPDLDSENDDASNQHAKKKQKAGAGAAEGARAAERGGGEWRGGELGM